MHGAGIGEMLIDAQNIKTGKVCELVVERTLRFGQAFQHQGQRYRRLVNRIAPPGLGDDPGFHRKGPIVMWTEPFHGTGPNNLPYHDKDGYQVATNVRQLRNYAAKSKDTGRPVTWTK